MAQSRNRGLVLLFLLLCAITLAGVAQAVYIEKLLENDSVAALAAARDAASAAVAVADYQTSQAAYLAPGQESSFWMTRADGLASTIRDLIDRRSASTGNPETRAAYDDAGGVLDELGKLDLRARSLLRNEERSLASEVIFTDCLQQSGRLAQALSKAHEIDRQSREARMTRLGQIRLAGSAAAALAALLCGWMLFLRAKRATAAPESMPVTQPHSATSLSLSPVKMAPPAAAAPVAAAPASPAPPVVSASPVSDVRLSDAAELCVDLARLLDGRDIPALFERAADVLDAKGLVLWVADAGGTHLRPSLTHGYSEKVLARMHALPLDGDNATALAFRSLRAQVVGAASPVGAGALAVPLVTASGCVGVLSAEVRKPRPGGDTLSVAQMIAAQFSALVAPAEPGAKVAQA